MPKYQVVVPHDSAQCIDALEEMMEHDADFHSQVFYGCHVGDCTGYALVEAPNEEEVRRRIPDRLRKRARVVGVEYVRPEEIRTIHEKPA